MPACRLTTRRFAAPGGGSWTRRSGVRGDWTVRRPSLDPGGWAFEFENDNYPDIDDTAEVVPALRHLDLADAVDAAERGSGGRSAWASRDGGWGVRRRRR